MLAAGDFLSESETFKPRKSMCGSLTQETENITKSNSPYCLPPSKNQKSFREDLASKICRIGGDLGFSNRLYLNFWDVGSCNINTYFCPDLELLGFPHSSVGKEFTCNAGDPNSISGLGRSPGEGKGYPLQYSGLENSLDYIVCGVAKSRR